MDDRENFRVEKTLKTEFNEAIDFLGLEKSDCFRQKMVEVIEQAKQKKELITSK